MTNTIPPSTWSTEYYNIPELLPKILRAAHAAQFAIQRYKVLEDPEFKYGADANIGIRVYRFEAEVSFKYYYVINATKII